MKDENLEPIQAIFSPDDTLPVEIEPALPNYEKLSAALRQDMREASKELLKLRNILLVAVEKEFGMPRLTFWILMNYVEDALAALDCTDHLVSEGEDDA